MNTPELRARVAQRLLDSVGPAKRLTAFVGLDGFVDEIFHVVDKRESPEQYQRLTTIAKFSERLAAAAGTSTNVELVRQLTKLGGNGPIMANALASFGFQVTYLGLLGYPSLHPIFTEFGKHAEVHSIAEPGYTDALEFEDGKIMMGKHQSLREMNWPNIKARFGAEEFTARLQRAQLVGFVNWTMLTLMSDIWAAILKEVCPHLTGPRRKLFIDLADPEKRTATDIAKGLTLVTEFQKYFDVILGLNESESIQIGANLGLPAKRRTPEDLTVLTQEIRARLKLESVVVHPTAYAVACGPDGTHLVTGPFTPKPKITTGAGDHFNAGFCLGKMLGFGTAECLLTGVSTSGHYVRTAHSPALTDLAELMRNWPA